MYTYEFWSRMKSFLLFSPVKLSLVALLLMPVTVFAQAPGRLSFEPNRVTAQTGETFFTDVIVDTGGLATGGTGAKIIFDPASVKVINIEAGDIYADYPALIYDNKAGEITISGIVSSVNSLYTGSGVFARIGWQGVTPGVAIAQFEFEPGNTTDSNIATMIGTGDALGSVGSLTVTLSGESLFVPQTPIPVVPAETDGTEGEPTDSTGQQTNPNQTPQPTATPSTQIEAETESTGILGSIGKVFGGILGSGSKADSAVKEAQPAGFEPGDSTQYSEDDLYQPIGRLDPNTSSDRTARGSDDNDQVLQVGRMTHPTSDGIALSTLAIYGLTIILVGVIFAGVYWFWRKKHPKVPGEKVIRL